MPTSAPSEHHYHTRIVWLALVIALVILGIVWLISYLQRLQHVRQAVVTPVSATPQSFDDFVGTLASASDTTLTVDMVTTDHAGQQHHRTYHVTVGDQTVIQSVNGTTLTTIGTKDLKAGDHLQVAADTDIAPTDHFTATKIFQLLSS